MMTRIPSDLARFGLRVELVPGWETRGSSAFAPACVVDHWTAGPRGTTGRPSLNVVTYGRTDLAGPLCNVYLARDGTCVVVAAGRANHAGAGGFRGLVGNSAAYGIEAESGGDGDWTPEMLDAYPRLNAALLSGLGRDASWVASHSEWAPTRKIDIRDVIGRVRADTAQRLANPQPPAAQQEDDMPQLMHDFVPAGERRTYSIPPPEGGGAVWGRAWLSVMFDRHGDDGAADPQPATFIRVGIQGADGRWRPAWGSDMVLPLRPGTRPTVMLQKDDKAIVVDGPPDTEEHGVGWLIEYASR